MKVSVLLPIFNRSRLLDLGLQSLMRQTMSKEDWEMVLIDEMSKEDLSKVYSRYPINVRHIRFNSAGHLHYKGYHTPSLALNLGIRKAIGEVLCISQPEMLHSRENLMRGWHQALQDEFIFGKIILSHRHFTEWIKENIHLPFAEWWKEAIALADPFPDNALYWFIGFIKKEYAVKIGGVDEDYMEGVYGEDDNFKERLRLAGILPALNQGIRGVHINHEYEGDLYPKQDRNAAFWQRGAERNREKFYTWLETRSKTDIIANQDLKWGDERYIVEIKEQKI